MAKISCLIANHKTVTADFDEYCVTCLENKIEKLTEGLESIASADTANPFLHAKNILKEVEEI